VDLVGAIDHVLKAISSLAERPPADVLALDVQQIEDD